MNGTLKKYNEEFFYILSASINRNYFINCLKMLNQSEVSSHSMKILEEIFNFILTEV